MLMAVNRLKLEATYHFSKDTNEQGKLYIYEYWV